MKVLTGGGGFLTKAQAARYTALSVRTLDSIKAGGDLPFYRFSRRKVCFRVKDLDHYMARFRVDVAEVQT